MARATGPAAAPGSSDQAGRARSPRRLCQPAERIARAEATEATDTMETTEMLGAAEMRAAARVGGVVEQSAGVLAVRGGRVIVMTEEAYILLLRIIHEHAPHIIKYAFYDMGYRAGVDIMAGLTESDLAPEDAVQRFVERYVQAGYGDLAVTHFDLAAPEARLSGVNLFEAGLAPKAGIY